MMRSPSTGPVATELWPALPYDAWKDTYATLHMWTQVVGKVALAQAPPLNHSWGDRDAGDGARPGDADAAARRRDRSPSSSTSSITSS